VKQTTLFRDGQPKENADQLMGEWVIKIMPNPPPQHADKAMPSDVMIRRMRRTLQIAFPDQFLLPTEARYSHAGNIMIKFPAGTANSRAIGLMPAICRALDLDEKRTVYHPNGFWTQVVAVGVPGCAEDGSIMNETAEDRVRELRASNPKFRNVHIPNHPYRTEAGDIIFSFIDPAHQFTDLACKEGLVFLGRRVRTRLFREKDKLWLCKRCGSIDHVVKACPHPKRLHCPICDGEHLREMHCLSCVECHRAKNDDWKTCTHFTCINCAKYGKDKHDHPASDIRCPAKANRIFPMGVAPHGGQLSPADRIWAGKTVKEVIAILDQNERLRAAADPADPNNVRASPDASEAPMAEDIEPLQ
jgi:hypothetical protein